MNPEILGVKESVRLGANSVPVQVLQVTWKAGSYGPFTFVSSFADLNSGKLMDDLRMQARGLANLPVAAQTT